MSTEKQVHRFYADKDVENILQSIPLGTRTKWINETIRQSDVPTNELSEGTLNNMRKAFAKMQADIKRLNEAVFPHAS